MKIQPQTAFDLTPAWRIAARSRRRRYRRWGLWVATYVVGLMSLFALLEVGRQTRQTALGEDLHEATRQLITLREDLRMLNRQRLGFQAALADTRIIRDQVDWSVPLCVLADHVGSTIVLDTCTLSATSPNGRPGDPSCQYLMLLAGHARAQSEVWAFATRLEKTGLFGSVRLLGTREGPFMDSRAVEFHMECGFSAKGATP